VLQPCCSQCRSTPLGETDHLWFRRCSPSGSCNGTLLDHASTRRRATPIVQGFRSCYPTLRASRDTPLRVPLPRRLEISVRTNSTDLITACNALSVEPFDAAPEGFQSALWEQLHRFHLKFVLLPSDAAEVTALCRWGTAECRPGQAFEWAEESRRTRVEEQMRDDDFEGESNFLHVKTFHSEEGGDDE
jgi:hypothetical protein